MFQRESQWRSLVSCLANDVAVHLVGIDVPVHFCFVDRGHSAQVLEELIRHLLVDLSQ